MPLASRSPSRPAPARPVRERVCARVPAVNGAGEVLLHGWDPAARHAPYWSSAGGGLEPLEVGTIDRAAWWTPDALDEDGTAASQTLTTIMRAAVHAVLGGKQ